MILPSNVWKTSKCCEELVARREPAGAGGASFYHRPRSGTGTTGPHSLGGRGLCCARRPATQACATLAIFLSECSLVIDRTVPLLPRITKDWVTAPPAM